MLAAPNTLCPSPDPRRLAPAYSVAEAARYLHIPETTLRSWVAPRAPEASAPPARSRPLIVLDDPHHRYLSFFNLVEAHVLAAIRQARGLNRQELRAALDSAARLARGTRPLIDRRLLADPRGPFPAGRTGASPDRRQAIIETLDACLQRIEWDSRGFPSKLYPFIRHTESPAAPSAASRLIVINPAVSFGRPALAGSGVPTSSLYERYQAGDSIATLARDFGLETSAVEEAIRYEAA